MTLDSLPDLDTSGLCLVKTLSNGTDVLAVSEHGAPGRRPNIHAHFVGRQREDGLDTLPARAAEPSGARAKNERSESVQGSEPRETIERRAASENPLRATTINDCAKLGTALGGTPTIVERLPSRATSFGMAV